MKNKEIKFEFENKNLFFFFLKKYIRIKFVIFVLIKIYKYMNFVYF